MTSAEFVKIRKAANMSLSDLSDIIRVHTRTIRRYEDGSIPISGPVSKLMEMIKEEILAIARECGFISSALANRHTPKPVVDVDLLIAFAQALFAAQDKYKMTEEVPFLPVSDLGSNLTDAHRAALGMMMGDNE